MFLRGLEIYRWENRNGRALEHKLQRKLKLAGVLSARDTAEVRREGYPVRNVEICVVEEVVGLGAKL